MPVSSATPARPRQSAGMNTLVCAAALLAAAGAAPSTTAGQSPAPAPSLLPDRPGLGDAAHVLASGVVQVEAGGTIDGVENDEFFTAAALVRVGFGEAELRLFLPSLVTRQQGDNFRAGDLGIGAKVALRGAAAPWKAAVGGTVTLPTGSTGPSAEDPTASLVLIAERALPRGTGIAFNVGYGRRLAGGDDGTLSLLVTPTFPIPGVDGVGGYVGYAGAFREGRDAHVVEWGVAWTDGPDLQWDVNAGYDPRSNDWFLGAGVAVRRR